MSKRKDDIPWDDIKRDLGPITDPRAEQFVKYGMEQDFNVEVEINKIDDLWVLRIKYGDEDPLLVSPRSALDLQHKLGIAICDWIGLAVKECLDE